MAASNITNEIIITAMDRFVWFVLLVVMSHLVTEFTRVTGYARGNRNDVVVVNDSYVLPKSVANMIFYPGEEYGLYDHQISQQYNNIYPNNNNNNHNYNQNNNNNNYNSNNNPHAAVMTGPQNAETIAPGFPFSFRPIIDSIFEIPISTLRAVNNLVARLTGSYHHQVPSLTATGGGGGGGGILKSTTNNNNKNGSPEKLQAFPSLPTGGGIIAEAASLVTSATEMESVASVRNNNSKNSNSSNNNNNKSKTNKSRMPEIRMQSSLLREVNA